MLTQLHNGVYSPIPFGSAPLFDIVKVQRIIGTTKFLMKINKNNIVLYLVDWNIILIFVVSN
jgi:hypothetical protein